TAIASRSQGRRRLISREAQRYEVLGLEDLRWSSFPVGDRHQATAGSLRSPVEPAQHQNERRRRNSGEVRSQPAARHGVAATADTVRDFLRRQFWVHAGSQPLSRAARKARPGSPRSLHPTSFSRSTTSRSVSAESTWCEKLTDGILL